MSLESLTELEERMEKENIEYLSPEKGNKHVVMLRQPVRIIDMDNREVLYYTIVKVIDFNEDGDIIDKGMYYTLFSEDTLNDMVRQVSNSDANQCSTENMYV